MENWIQLTWLNDFIFCPYSVYLHQIYHKSDEDVYHGSHQAKGKRLHDFVEKNLDTYSMNNAYVYSARWQIYGKIDVYDKSTRILTEYKSRASTIYRGYYYQIWAQYLCMTEMGYPIEGLAIYDFKARKEHILSIPQSQYIAEIVNHIQTIRDYNFGTQIIPNANKCRQCIYNELCDQKID